MKKLNVFSAFHGIGCFNVAAKRAGLNLGNVYTSEKDEAANKVDKLHFPENTQLGDVLNIKSNDLPDLDLLVGGSPCQGFSRMGKQANFKDPRSKLFYEFLRILDDKKPTYFLLENVRMDDYSKNLITKYLGVKHIEINSKLVSAQSRNRLYWTNIPGVQLPEDRGILLKDVLEEDLIDPNNIPQGMKIREKSKTVRVGGRSSPVLSKQEWDYPYKKLQPKTVLRDSEYLRRKEVRRYSVKECCKLQTLPPNYLDVPGISKTDAYKMLGNCWTVDVIAHILKYIPK